MQHPTRRDTKIGIGVAGVKYSRNKVLGQNTNQVTLAALRHHVSRTVFGSGGGGGWRIRAWVGLAIDARGVDIVNDFIEQLANEGCSCWMR